MHYNTKRGLGIFLFLIGIFTIASLQLSITGNVISENLGNVGGSILGLVLIIGGLAILQMARAMEIGGLEEISKMFYTDNMGVVRINDFGGEFSQEGIQTGFSNEAREVLKQLKEKYGKDPKLKREVQEIIFPEYIKSALSQRDSSGTWPITPGSEVDLSDKFLQEWDPNYAKHPLKHPLLREEEHDTYLNPSQGGYDTREIIEIFKSNVGNISNVPKNIPSHDLYFDYNGSRIGLMAGSRNPYETDTNAINETLRSMARIDKRKDPTLDEGERYKILKKVIYKKN